MRYMVWIVALALAGWIFSRLPFTNLAQTISNLRLSQWLIWIALNLLVIALLTGRWLVLTRAMALTCRFWQLLCVRQAGQMISFVTPGPQFGGEPLQVYWLWRRYGVPGHAAFLAVGLDRFYELWVNFAVLLLAVLALLASRSMAFIDWQLIALTLLGLILLMGFFGWLVLRKPLQIREWIDRLSRRWQHHQRLRDLDTHVALLHQALQQLIRSQRPALTVALGLSLLGWAGMIAEFWLLLSFVDVPLDLATFVFLFTVLRLAFLLPLPGGIGSVEAGLFWAFQALALPLPAAAGLIVLMRLRDVVILLAAAATLPGLRSPLPEAVELK
ncbi:MAG: lysylphosphatidylglycerol synthase transmembrane domain-containing protein [Pseudohongiellaceae bacterium]